jgi:hypothetical protein
MYTSDTIQHRGFSLIETLVAVSVMMMAIAGPLSIASRGLLSAQFARDQVIAFHLAREATELIRNRRDMNVINGLDWLDGMDECLSPGVCRVDALSGTLDFIACPTGGCNPLNIQRSEGVYAYDTGVNWEESRFIRDITIVEHAADREIAVTVDITWSTGTLTKTFTITEHFFNW